MGGNPTYVIVGALFSSIPKSRHHLIKNLHYGEMPASEGNLPKLGIYTQGSEDFSKVRFPSSVTTPETIQCPWAVISLEEWSMKTGKRFDYNEWEKSGHHLIVGYSMAETQGGAIIINDAFMNAASTLKKMFSESEIGEGVSAETFLIGGTRD